MIHDDSLTGLVLLKFERKPCFKPLQFNGPTADARRVLQEVGSGVVKVELRRPLITRKNKT